MQLLLAVLTFTLPQWGLGLPRRFPHSEPVPSFERLGGGEVRFSEHELLRTKEERHAQCQARILDANDPQFLEKLVKDYKKPAMITNLITSWPALDTWSLEQFRDTIENRFHSNMLAKPWNFSDPVNPQCDDMVKCFHNGWLAGENFETKRRIAKLFSKYAKKEYFDQMNKFTEEKRGDHVVRKFDTPNALLFDVDVDEENALFEAPTPKILEPSAVSRHIAFGAFGTSHGLHRHNEAFQGQIVGYKSWYLLPPHIYTQPVNETTTSAPFGFPHEQSQRKADSICGFKPTVEKVKNALITCVQGPGEAMYVPDQFWHSTCNLDFFTAATGAGLSWRKSGLIPDFTANVTFVNIGQYPLETFVVATGDDHEQNTGLLLRPGQESPKMVTRDGFRFRFKNKVNNFVEERVTHCDDGAEITIRVGEGADAKPFAS